MNRPKARILVVEDDPAMLQGLQDYLVFNGFETAGAADGPSGRDMALEQRFDLILLDVMLPGLDGFSICREVRKQKPGQPVIMLTAKGSEEDVITGFKAGADDYISKPFSLRELMVRVQAILRRAGRTGAEAEITIRGVRFDGAQLKAEGPQGMAELTRREMDIILFLAAHPDRIVSKRDLLADVWQYPDPDVETRTVDIHLQKLRKKIAGVFGEEPFIETVRGEGYRLTEEGT
jgi:DNA-binding response OmpR family regulator